MFVDKESCGIVAVCEYCGKQMEDNEFDFRQKWVNHIHADCFYDIIDEDGRLPNNLPIYFNHLYKESSQNLNKLESDIKYLSDINKEDDKDMIDYMYNLKDEQEIIDARQAEEDQLEYLWSSQDECQYGTLHDADDVCRCGDLE